MWGGAGLSKLLVGRGDHRPGICVCSGSSGRVPDELLSLAVGVTQMLGVSLAVGVSLMLAWRRGLGLALCRLRLRSELKTMQQPGTVQPCLIFRWTALWWIFRVPAATQARTS